ncbi:hypothetical protein SMMN14_08733 [Sphaerulina musiva]
MAASETGVERKALVDSRGLYISQAPVPVSAAACCNIGRAAARHHFLRASISAINYTFIDVKTNATASQHLELKPILSIAFPKVSAESRCKASSGSSRYSAFNSCVSDGSAIVPLAEAGPNKKRTVLRRAWACPIAYRQASNR